MLTYGAGGAAPHTELAKVGPIIDIEIRGLVPEAAPVRARGLIDTGATGVVIDRRIALRLGLKAIDQVDVFVVGGGSIPSTVYMGILGVPVLGYSELTRMHSAPMMHGHDVLLGRSFLQHFIVTFNGPEGMFHFYPAFQSPTPHQDDDFAT